MGARMEIIKAEASAYEATRRFYHSLIDEMGQAGNVVTWVKDVYPSPEFLQASAQAGTLYLGMEDDEIAAAMVLNHEAGEGYRGAPWNVKANDEEVLVIHALGVHPRFGGKGLGAQMTEGAIRIARDAGMKAVRLDVQRGNEPARRIYVRCGFKSTAEVSMYYENTGLDTFELFEFAL